MNSTIKTMLAMAANRSGLLALLKRGAATNVVFALHRVLPNADTGNVYDRNVSVNVEAFEAFLVFLSANFQIVALEDFLAEWRKGSAKGLATLTFDDGWIDNYQYAYPLLAKLRIPATIFLPTALIGTNQRLPEERIVDL